MEQGERAPLLGRQGSVPADLHMSGLEPRSLLYSCSALPNATFRRYWWIMLITVLSWLLCVLGGYSNSECFDPLIFKAIFIVFGFLIGFRNARANLRRGQALEHSMNFFGALWGIITIYPQEMRSTIVEELLAVADAVAEHVDTIATSPNYMLGIVGLQPIDEDHDRMFTNPDTVVEAELSAYSYMMTTLYMCEDKIQELEKPGQGQKLIRTFWAQKATLIGSYFGMVHLAMPSVSVRFTTLINAILCIFAVCAPWGLKNVVSPLKTVHGKDVSHFLTELWQLANALIMVSVLLSLNTLAHEHEDPFGGDADDVKIRKVAGLFRTACKKFTHHRLTCALQCISQKALVESAV